MPEVAGIKHTFSIILQSSLSLGLSLNFYSLIKYTSWPVSSRALPQLPSFQYSLNMRIADAQNHTWLLFVPLCGHWGCKPVLTLACQALCQLSLLASPPSPHHTLCYLSTVLYRCFLTLNPLPDRTFYFQHYWNISKSSFFYFQFQGWRDGSMLKTWVALAAHIR